ncbi:ribokinase [Cysteiniphilum sp. QT6929]|uniref:ribokinase n=1 Tax=Cysteiniphilum sp. QT6929 TaxID=2975055 RepID=UPI0024B3B677|nr:ribokinase [Cysteiniphilum sp. QT6929]WHN65498.1 ribokinase [Cysteiniphilum sp. QT6929]
MTIMVIGSANMDLIIQVEHIPSPGETILGGQFLTASGGKGANQAVASARLGSDVCFVSCVGEDSFGETLINNYRKDNINIKHIKRSTSPSGVAMIYVAQNGENSIAVAPGANALLTPQDLDKLTAQFAHSQIVLTQLETPIETIMRAGELAKSNQCLFVLNPAPAQSLPDTLYPLIDIITPNETEAALLTGIEVTDESSALMAAKVLFNRGVSNVIITMGAKGAFFYDGNNAKLIPTHKVAAIDTTAAGDTFNGALVSALAQNNTLLEAIAFANKAAALSVTKLGAQSSIPYLDEITHSTSHI